MKKEWRKPVITVIARSTTEENVLWACKGFPEYPFGDPGGPGDYTCGIVTEDGGATYIYCHPGANS